MNKTKKLLRFLTIYGFSHSLFKVAGRLRKNISLPTFKNQNPDVGIVGCGQFAFATIGFFLQKAFGRRIAVCYDIDPSASRSFAQGFKVQHLAADVEDLLSNKVLKTVYIASNHASHTEYAIEAINRGVSNVYIEKPISVTQDQLISLLRSMRNSESRVFAGYNRPFSSAVHVLQHNIKITTSGGFSIQCFVAGHKLAPEHWYRNPEEGTRICGNIGHWLDLAVHILSWRGMPDILQITLNMADECEPDDNIIVSFSSDRGDIFSVLLTSRCEPFEGINETINIQHADTICKIDDFRRMMIWQGDRLIKKRFWPKDVGHKLAILQPFQTEVKRDWNEVVLSTLLMLHVADMVKNNCVASAFSFRESLKIITSEIESK